MSEAFVYDLDALAAAHEDIAAAVKDFDRTRFEVEQLLKRLRTAWTEGAAAEAALAYQAEWVTIFADVTVELRLLGAIAEQSRQNALTVEAANRDMWA